MDNKTDFNKVNTDAVTQLEEAIKETVENARHSKVEVSLSVEALQKVQNMFDVLDDETKSQTLEKCIDITHFILVHHMAGSRVIIEEAMKPDQDEPVYHIVQFPEFDNDLENKIIVDDDNIKSD